MPQCVVSWAILDLCAISKCFFQPLERIKIAFTPKLVLNMARWDPNCVKRNVAVNQTFGVLFCQLVQFPGSLYQRWFGSVNSICNLTPTLSLASSYHPVWATISCLSSCRAHEHVILIGTEGANWIENTWSGPNPFSCKCDDKACFQLWCWCHERHECYEHCMKNLFQV